MAPKVAIILLNWNGYADTTECLLSLKRIDYPNYEIIVVDNGSMDSSGDRIKSEFPYVTLLKNRENLGFAGGCNTGIRFALDRGFPYIYLLNNDTVVDTKVLSTLVDAAEEDPRAGILSSKIYYFNDKNVIWYAGATFDPLRGCCYNRGIGQADRDEFSIMGETDRACGCSMLVKSEVFAKVGLFDERFFCSFEEEDLCLRAKKAGFRIMYVPSSLLWHKVSMATGGANSPMNTYYSSRNIPLAYSKDGHIIMVHIWNLLKTAKNAVLFIVSPKKRARAKAVLGGIFDFYRGRFGRTFSKYQ